MQHDTLSEEDCAAFLAEDAQETIRPGPRRFEGAELADLVDRIVLRSTARCPDDDTWLVPAIAPEVIRLVCPQCGATAAWRVE